MVDAREGADEPDPSHCPHGTSDLLAHSRPLSWREDSKRRAHERASEDHLQNRCHRDRDEESSKEPLMRPVVEDLTLTEEKLSGQGFWRYVSWLVTPIVTACGKRLTASDALSALGDPAGDDHMLRLAALVDPAQYSRVSGARDREDRMTAVCRETLGPLGWTVTPRLTLTDPAAEVDVHAVREPERLVLQLKSTRRPEMPWEVYKRNADILVGIRQAANIQLRLGESTTAVVITDGYRGNYTTWRAARPSRSDRKLEDLDRIARYPGRPSPSSKNRQGA